jgi:hypothetical protein
MSDRCKHCGGIPHEWVLTDKGTFRIEACEKCPAPDAEGSPLQQVLGAILYDDGTLHHWERAEPTLRALQLSFWEEQLVAIMRHVFANGRAPNLVEIVAATWPRSDAGTVWRWWLYYLLDQAAYANGFDRALVDAVRENNRRTGRLQAVRAAE